MKKLLLLFSVLTLTLSTWGTDFTIGIASYYITNNSTNTVSIGTGGIDPAISVNTAGIFTIPSSVSYGGKTYSVTGVGPYAFRGCNKLTAVTIPNSITRITSSAFQDCAGLTSMVLPNSVTSIGGSAFLSCTELTSFTFSNSLATIGVGTFQNCPKLTSINLPNSLTSIGNYAFVFCSGLTSVTIPSSVTNIGTQAFKDCSALSSIFLKNSNPSAIALGEYLFYSSPVSTCKLYVPAGSKTVYQAAYQWGDFANNTIEEGSNALHFDGVNDYVALPSVATNLSTFTIEMWVKPSSVLLTGNIALLNTNSWDATNGNSVHFQTEGGKVIVSVNGLSLPWPSSEYTLLPNVWQHLALTYDKPNSAIKFYVNGVLIKTISRALQFAKIDAASVGSWGGTQRFFNGAIDEVRIWNTVRTDTDIANNMSTPITNPASTSGLLSYFDFNQGVAGGSNTGISTLYDGSASSLSGALKNFALSGATSNFMKGYPILNLSATTASIGKLEGSSTTVNVTSTTSWSAVSDQSWLTVSPASGTDDGTLTFTAAANPTVSTRTATVTFSGTGVASKTVTVTQDAASVFLELSTDGAASIGAVANSTVTVDVISNTAWTAASNETWLRVIPLSGTGNSALTFVAAANPTIAPRTATITVTATAVSDQITTAATQTVTVTQAEGVNTGIETAHKETLIFSPNPTQKGFTINAGDQKSILSIYDLSGSLMLTKEISGKSYIDVTTLPTGIYMVKANGRMGKLIKK